MANRISVVIDVVTDRANTALGSFKTSIAGADGALGKFKAGTKSAGDSLKANMVPVAAAAGAALAAFAVKSVQAASNLDESINAVTKTYGENAEAVLAIGDNAADSFGLSARSFNQAAVAFSSFAKEIAGPGGDVAATVDELTGRAADFASVMNIEVAEAATVFSSGLSGETEPLKKFGINLSAAAVEAYALSQGMAASKGEITESIKVQARYGLLLEKTSHVAGDFADTSDGLANSQRIATAKIEEFQAQVGEGLLPVVANAVTLLTDMGDAMQSVGFKAGGLGEKLDENRGLFGDIANSVENVLNPLQQGAQVINTVKDALDGSSDAAEDVVDAFDSASGSMVQASIDAALLDKRTAELTEATEDAAEASADLKDELTLQRAALEKLTAAKIIAAGGTFDLEKAELDLANATAASTTKITEATLILLDSKRTDEEKAQATRHIRNEQIGVAESSLKVAEAYAEEAGAADGSAESARLQVEKLRELQEQYPENAAAIQPYIDKLLAIPGVVDTKISADTLDANRSLDQLQGRLNAMGSTATSVSVVAANRFRQRATGGIVGAGETTLVGERGPELAEFPAGTRIHTASQTAAMVGSNGMASPRGGGTTVVNINLSGADPQQTVAAIDQWERRNGPRR